MSGGVISTRMPRQKTRVTLNSLLDDARARHRTDASAVAETLRLAIVTGVLPANIPLRQDLLASDLGVSRMPIREGIRRLESEGLVDFIPHCGAVVAPLRPEDIREIAQMRVALECLALDWALAQPTIPRLEEAEHWLAQLDDAESLVERNVLNRRFHYALYGFKPTTRMRRHIDMLYDAYERYLIVEHSQLDRRARSQAEHRAIFSACLQGDRSKARAALQAHIEGAADELLAHLANQQKSA
jgi:DNA-binding GntR family transcriptional regulator